MAGIGHPRALIGAFVPTTKGANSSKLEVFESASRPLVDFGVLNDNLIKGLILCVK
jgi:hypothetical protein